MPADKPSKSARKREFLALQELGEKLIDLADEQLDTLDLDETLAAAVRDARQIRSHGALRRQKQLIGKLMRQTDPEPIRRALHEFGQHDRLANELFRSAEKWRDRIATEGEAALAEFFALIGGENRALSELARSLGTAPTDKSRRLLRRRIFGEVRKELASVMQNTSR